MLTFEKLLVKELQKQQSRAEFCDIVLQSQGVSVPVHGCVLSAFSPWLCGALSSMPSPRNGQRRLIEVPAVEACTLLSLVSLLYSGQFSENKEDVQSAASKLGIEIPRGEVQRPANDQNTQTECMKELTERHCQTETLTSECQNPKDSIDTVNLSSWRSDEGLRLYADGSEITLEPLQNIQGNPEILPSFQALDAAPESVVYPTVSGPACLPQVYVCPPAASLQQTSIPLAQSSCVEGLSNQGAPAGISGGAECVLEAFTQFENNIPGFINYFLDANVSEDARQRGTRGDVKIEGRGRRARGAGANGGFNVKVERVTVCRRQKNTNRCGRVARSIGMGQGGGRVGRTLDTRQMFKIRGRRKQQGRGVMKEEAETGRSSSRGRARQRGTGSRGRSVEPAGQEPAPKRRGRPRKQPMSRNSSDAPPQKTINAPAPSMMHTAPLPAANQSSLTQPMDWLIDDVIAQLPFMPTNQNGITSTAVLDSSLDHPRTQSSMKLADIGIVQPQSEGELNDILDSFLRTFEHHVGSCDADFQDVPSVTNGSQTGGQNYASNTQPTSMNTTTQASKITRRPRAARRAQKPFGYWQVTGVKMEKSQGEEMPKTGRMTRSQNRKRKLEVIEEMREPMPAKRRRKTKWEQKGRTNVDTSLVKGRTTKSNGETQHISGTVDSNCNITSALKKVINKVKSPKASDHIQNSSSFLKKKQVCHPKRESPKPHLAGNTSQPKQSVTVNKTGTPRPAVSAFEIMKKILENQQKREEEQKDYGVWTVKKQKGKKRPEDRRVEVNGHNRSRGVNQNDEETGGRRKTDGDHTTSKGERLIENSDGESRFQTTDSPNHSPLQKSVVDKNITNVPFISHLPQKTDKKLRNARGSSDSSDEDIDVVEVSGSLTESFAVLPVTDIILSTDEEEEDSDEDGEIDVISVGSS